jgi:hypothetical protein
VVSADPVRGAPPTNQRMQGAGTILEGEYQ